MKKLFLLAFIISACSEKPEPTLESAQSVFQDSVYLNILEWQDRRNSDRLVYALQEMSGEYKVAAAMALASVQDESTIMPLESALPSASFDLQKAILYALGQTYDSAAFFVIQDFLKSSDKLDPMVKNYAYEAIGKTIPSTKLDYLYGLHVEDTTTISGFAWALYRSGLRGLWSDMSTRAALNILDTTSSYRARLGAAHYLGRVGYNQLPGMAYRVLNKDYDSPEVRMAIALAYRKASEERLNKNIKKFIRDSDYRVRINAIRAATRPSMLKDSFDTLFNDPNVNVSVAIAERIEREPAEVGKENIQEILNHDLNWRVRAILLEALLKIENDDELVAEIQDLYRISTNPYEKAALLSALAHSFSAYDFIITQTFADDHPAISTAGISALAEMRQKENFPDELKGAFKEVFLEAMASDDVALMGITASVLRNPQLGYKDSLKDYSFIQRAKDRLSLPRDNETLQSLEQTLAYFEDREPEKVENVYNHPVDWEKVKDVAVAKTATINTNRGLIKMRLLTEKAPGTVLNFINLAREEYFNDKVFHRVVPNFVIQGGGNRGDGLGSEDYSIRSEFADVRYTTGSVGMASAGKDTEGTQWFITHSPTPHLDGGYTIFAQVVEGMDVVHQIQVGDTIKYVTIE